MTNHYTDVCEATIESLRQQLADVKIVSDHNLKVYQAAAEELRQQLAAALAAIKVKDGALQSAISAHGYASGDLHDALAIQPDDSAIKEGLDQAWCRDPDQ